jgi:hypothetical protein
MHMSPEGGILPVSSIITADVQGLQAGQIPTWTMPESPLCLILSEKFLSPFFTTVEAAHENVQRH